MLIRENVPLAPLTTLGVGGPARFFAEAVSAEDVRRAVHHAGEHHLPLFVLGGGSNLVVSDSGWPGLVLRIRITGVEEHEESGNIVLDVGAGEEWDGVVARAVARDCAGIECLSGIPGSVGGTPVQNVGAYGQEVSETIANVQALDLRDGQLRNLCNPACGFAYRTSIFNTSERGRYVILRVTYALAPGGQPRIEYADLKKYFAARSGMPTLVEVREAVRQIRAGKAMLIVPGGEDCRSAGSFFKNPVLTGEQHKQLSDCAAALGLQVPSYPALASQHKISAAWLVEHSGLSKGYSLGPVGISRKHALAIVNRGGATAADVVTLKNEIQQRVADTFGIQLSPEPVFVGFDQNLNL